MIVEIILSLIGAVSVLLYVLNLQYKLKVIDAAIRDLISKVSEQNADIERIEKWLLDSKK